ncbi:MAG: outer membrane beta-barrel protein, partial [Glaciimonas sp.]|nr:outer membrane beta-barrel protein [Glaciimonas sp.]
WAPFNANANQFQVSSQRLMFNVYKDFAINQQFSVFGTLGLGLAFINAEGWQSNDTRRFANRTQTNLAYSAGVGMSYAVTPKIKVDLGYRFVDMGNIESGFNTFVNRISARDEQLKANLKSNEIFLGMRASF